jgi:hypothetical protein
VAPIAGNEVGDTGEHYLSAAEERVRVAIGVDPASYSHLVTRPVSRIHGCLGQDGNEFPGAGKLSALRQSVPCWV